MTTKQISDSLMPCGLCRRVLHFQGVWPPTSDFVFSSLKTYSKQSGCDKISRYVAGKWGQHIWSKFKEVEIIIVNSHVDVKPGDFVIVKNDDEEPPSSILSGTGHALRFTTNGLSMSSGRLWRRKRGDRIIWDVSRIKTGSSYRIIIVKMRGTNEQ